MRDQLTLFVLSYDSFKSKDSRRACAENSSLADLTAYQCDAGTAVDVDGADDTTLISVLAGTNPIVIVGETHHAGSKLSLDMLRNLNPRFVLELTDDAQSKSHQRHRTGFARELKTASMAKLPVVVYRCPDKRAVAYDAVTLQHHLEEVSKQDEARDRRHVRHIVLFQAEWRGADDAETYQRLRDKFVEGGIPEGQIAIRTSDVDELRGADLMGREHPTCFTIAVEALAEGRDRPFAYVLATVENKSSQVSVEQIVGRVLSQPYATRACSRFPNIAYVFTASADFDATLEQIVRGLTASASPRTTS